VTRKADDGEILRTGIQADDRPVCGPADVVRVCSGVLKRATAFSARSGQEGAHWSAIVQMHANNREEVSEIRAGDIAACVGLKTCHG
jgi:elongation factor G